MIIYHGIINKFISMFEKLLLFQYQIYMVDHPRKLSSQKLLNFDFLVDMTWAINENIYFEILVMLPSNWSKSILKIGFKVEVFL